MKHDILKFRKLFGANPELFTGTVIISPFFSMKLFSSKVTKLKKFKGLVFKGIQGMYNGRKFSYVNTGIGQSLVADCVLALSLTKISKIVFLGAVGAVGNLKIADCVLVKEACFNKSYYQKLEVKRDVALSEEFQADEKLTNNCNQFAKNLEIKIKQVSVLSWHSLWEQEKEMIKIATNEKIHALDLECAFFYATANKKNIKSLALCYVSDHIINRPYWDEFSIREHLSIKNSVISLVKLALELI